jgi:lantibiotic modifying enzyme
MGVVEVLLTAGELLGQPGPVADARQAAGQIAAAVRDGGLRTNTPGGLCPADLLRGTAGIGYGLLRAIDPSKVPDILLAGT